MNTKRNAPLLHIADKIMRECVIDPSRLGVIFVLSVLGKSPIREDYDGFSISASFQKQNDLDDYIAAIRKFGFYVQTFVDERDFFSWVQNGGYDELSPKYKFVYTSAVNGIGPGRRALVPAYCSHMGISTLNQNAYSATVGRHKHHVSHLLAKLGLPVAESWLIDQSGVWLGNNRPKNGQRVIAKATYEGSSIGLGSEGILNYCANSDAIFIDLSKRLQQPVTVQEFLNGGEYEVPVFECDGCIEAWPQMVVDSSGPITGDRILSYEKVWSEDYGYAEPGSIPAETKYALRRIASEACSILGYKGVARIDIRLTDSGDPKIFDVSGTPDVTTMSSCASAIREMGGSYSDVWLVSLASALARKS
jgi:D-alanine-D-alanine ligase